MTETEELAALIARTEYDDIPSDVIEAATVAVRDYLGVAIYGSHDPIGDKIRSYAEQALPGNEAILLGGSNSSLEGAGLCNGVFGHATDYDDTFGSIPIHPTSPVFPATLAIADRENLSARELLAAYVVGVETAYRLGHSTYPEHYDKGFHSTGTMGTFGATAGVCSLLDLPSERIRHAIGIAGSSTSSLKKNIGTDTKPLHAGHAAQMGIQAGLLASSGFTADPGVLEGDRGYGAVLGLDGYDPAPIVDGGPMAWGVLDNGFKSYPCVLIAQAPMEALRTIVDERDLSPADVRSVTATMHDYAEAVLPYEEPETANEAKFSIEFCLAALLRRGDAGIHEFDKEFITDPVTRREMAKIEKVYDSDALGPDYGQYGGRVTVETDEATYTRDERQVPGSPDNPLPEPALRSKFIECAATVTSSEEAADLSDLVMELPDGDLETLLDRLAALES